MPPSSSQQLKIVQDIIQTLTTASLNLPPHPLESYLKPMDTLDAPPAPPPTSSSSSSTTTTTTQMEVYFNDFIALTNSSSPQHLTNWLQYCMVFTPSYPHFHSYTIRVEIQYLSKSKAGRWQVGYYKGNIGLDT